MSWHAITINPFYFKQTKNIVIEMWLMNCLTWLIPKSHQWYHSYHPTNISDCIYVGHTLQFLSFRLMPLGNVLIPFYLPPSQLAGAGLSRIATVLPQGWLWHKITYEVWHNSTLNCKANSSFEGVSSDHQIITAKIRLSLWKNVTRTITTVHYDWVLLNNWDIRDLGK